MYDNVIEGDLVQENYGLKGKINSIFDHVINIETDQHLGFAITDQSVILAPYHIKLQNNKFNKIINHINESSNIIIKKDKIIFDEKVINYKSKKIYNGIIEKTYYKKEKLIENTEKVLKNFAKSGSLDNTILNYQKIISKKVNKSNLLQKHFYTILKEIINGKKSVNDLLGLGIGLTPTGDDFIVGYLSAVESGLCKDKYHFIDVLTTKDIFNKTTRVSALHLKGVLEHRYNAKLVELYKNIDDSDIIYINNAKELIKIGSTSGVDMLSGIYFALTM